jgi:PAS domain S-box-containing protein
MVADRSLGTQGRLVIAIPVFALLAAMGVFYQFERQSQEAVRWVEHSHQVRSEIRMVLIRLLNMEAGARGYVLAHQNAFLQTYSTARRELPQAIDDLSRLVMDNPEETARVNHVRLLAGQLGESLESLTRSTHRNGEADSVALESSRSQMEELRVELNAMQDDEFQLLAERSETMQHAQKRLELAIFAGGLLGLIGGVMAASLFTTRIVRRVHQLELDARRVAEGLPIGGKISGNDEIGRLESTLQETSRLLTSQRDELRAAHAELEARVQQRTAELRSANERLIEATEMNEAVVRSSPLAIWTLDLDGNVQFWNPAAARIFGYTESEVVGRHLPIIPEDELEEYSRWLESFRRGETINGVERTRVKKDGTRIDVVIWTAPLRDAEGHIRGTIAIDSDLTEFKLLQEQFRQSQKLEAIGRLAGGVAHDFNNLLTVITGYTEMIVMEAEATSQPRVLDYGREIQYAAVRAGSLTSQLLAFSRRQISQPQVLNLNEIVEHSIKLLRRVIGEDISIHTILDPSLGHVKADPIHIDQVIMNLVVNARDAMSGGGELTIETRNQTLDADYVGRHLGVTAGQYCMLAISDTGTGMDETTRSRLFEPFFTTKPVGKGTGLGLSIVYGIVKQNGGEILVYSTPGRGTTFKIYLPRVDAAEEAAETAAALQQMRGTETILLCEDEDSIRRLVHTMLEQQGYHVIEAETPADAQRMAVESSRPIDLLLTDIVMPKTSGLELAKMVRELRPGIKVLYMSGYTDSQVSRAFVLDPNAVFVQKPFTSTSLLQKLREALTGH